MAALAHPSIVDNYFRDRAYYNLKTSNTDIDNPDQRIAEDVRSFTQESLTFCWCLWNQFCR